MSAEKQSSPQPVGQSSGAVEARVWHLRSGSIDEIVRTVDQWEAWDTLRDRDVMEFGLLASAEPDEDGDPLIARTSRLLFRWGRDEDAVAMCAAAVAQGLPDTTDRDREAARSDR